MNRRPQTGDALRDRGKYLFIWRSMNNVWSIEYTHLEQRPAGDGADSEVGGSYLASHGRQTASREKRARDTHFSKRFSCCQKVSAASRPKKAVDQIRAPAR